MPQIIRKSNFIPMPWKNGQGLTTQITIFPKDSKLENNDFLYRFSSAPIDKDGEFSLFPGKRRLLTPIKGAGFSINSRVFEKFEIADFAGEEKVKCSLLKGPVVDFGVIFDAQKVKAQARILELKANMTFSIETSSEYFVTVLDGALQVDEQNSISELETLHFQNESQCVLMPIKKATLFYLKLEFQS